MCSIGMETLGEVQSKQIAKLSDGANVTVQ